LEYSEDIGGDLTSHFQSHGQTSLPRVKAVSKMKGYIIFLDEPEAALSIRSQIIVAKCIKKASENNQVFVATHNSYIINMADEVLDLERIIWTSSEDFIKFQEEGKTLKRKKK
jgi:predicted ATPase